MIAIVDYGMGNLRSVEKALHKLGHAAEITSDAAAIARAERVVLPGVGAFGAAMANLDRVEQGGVSLGQVVRDVIRSGRPFLGICLGMQLLLSESDELGQWRGLDVIPGRVLRFDAQGDPDLKIPHMGWNRLAFPQQCPLFDGVTDGTQVYFVHGFYCRPDDSGMVAATCRHGVTFCAGLRQDNIYAVQFHPEKSGAAGMRILDNFAKVSVDGI